MRRIYCMFIPSLLCCLLLALSSCSDGGGLKEAPAYVRSMTDSTVVMSVDGEDATLLTADVRLVNGAFMPGDSVRLCYVGRLSSGRARAVIVTLLPRRPEVFEGGVDTSRELKTADPEPARSDGE